MKLVVGLIAMAAISIGLFQLQQGTASLSITRTAVGETPVTIFRPQSAAPPRLS